MATHAMMEFSSLIWAACNCESTESELDALLVSGTGLTVGAALFCCAVATFCALPLKAKDRLLTVVNKLFIELLEIIVDEFVVVLRTLPLDEGGAGVKDSRFVSFIRLFRLLVVIVSANRLRCTSLLLINGLVLIISMNCLAYVRNSSDLFISASDINPTQKITSLFRVPIPYEDE